MQPRSFTSHTSSKSSSLRARHVKRLAAACALSATVAGGAANRAQATPDLRTGTASLTLELVGAGAPNPHGDDLDAAVDVGMLGGVRRTVRLSELTDGAGLPCNSLRGLCKGTLEFTATPEERPFSVSIADRPTGSVPVFSGDCVAAGTQTAATLRTLSLAMGDQKRCRVTFVRADGSSSSAADSGLLVRTSHDDNRGALIPSGVFTLATGTLQQRSFGQQQLRDLDAPAALCSASSTAKRCERAEVFQAASLTSGLALSQTIDASWLPLYDGDCDERGRIGPQQITAGGALSCNVHHMRLDASVGPARNAALQVEVVARDGGEAATASLSIGSQNAEQIRVAPGALRTTAGTCNGFGSAMCFGAIGVEAGMDKKDVVSALYVSTSLSNISWRTIFSGDCDINGRVPISAGEVAYCHVVIERRPQPEPRPGLSIDDVVVIEGDAGTSQALLTLRTSFATNIPLSVSYTTANGSAVAGADYVAASGVATIPAGATSTRIAILIQGDRGQEGSETFTVRLTSSSGASLLDGSATVTITDNDGGLPPLFLFAPAK